MMHTLKQLTLLCAMLGAVYVKAQTNLNCGLVVPPNPLTASGLSTPYYLTNLAGDPMSGTCDQAAMGAFVQGAILDTTTGAIKIYNPLVINAGTTPAVAPTVPTIPVNHTVALWFGFNGNLLILQNTAGTSSLTQGNCHNGLANGVNGSPFGQFSFCNGGIFFNAAKSLINKGVIQVPALGTARDGLRCPTVRYFSVVDQDQSDNVVTTYLQVTVNGVTKFAQDIPKNRALFATRTVLKNASDNRLVSILIDTAFNCVPWMAPDAADTTGTQQVAALPLNELLAHFRQAAPVALIPENDPMVLVNGQFNLTKINVYRRGVGQPQAGSLSGANGTTYCANLIKIGFNRIQLNKAILQASASPDPAFASLYAFLVSRFGVAINGDNLNCVGMGFTNPFTAANTAAIATDLAASDMMGGSAGFAVGVASGAGIVFLGVGLAAMIISYRKRQAAYKNMEADHFVELNGKPEVGTKA